jgi:hypothetical protein
LQAVTKEHLLAFGGIIHHYAVAENGIKIALATLMGIELVDVMILTEPYSSLNLRNVAKSLAKVKEPINEPVRVFLQIVGDFGAFGAIRNNIAHNRWTDGSRPNSVKPSRLDIREGKARVYGASHEERDWLLEELYQQSDALVDLNKRIIQFLVDNDKEAAAIARETE